MRDPKIHLSATLKSVRKQQSLSLDQAAQKTGVSKAMLGQIERGESSPTLATLWKIATGLEVSLSSFIEPVPENARETIVRTAEDMRQNLGVPGTPAMHVAPLFPYDPHFGYEYMDLILEPGYDRVSEPHEAGVTEIMTVLDGQFDVYCDGQVHSLTAGQSIRFAGDAEHRYHNPHAEPCRIINLIHYGGR
jgi:transcriptional regulator with XRE-family HTH domain